MNKVNLEQNPFLIFNKDSKDLLAFSELQSLVEYAKPGTKTVFQTLQQKLKAQLDKDYQKYGNKNLEVNGANDGPFVNECLASVGLGPGQAWCMAYVFKTCKDCGIDIQKTGYVPALETWAKQKGIFSLEPEPLDIVMFYDNLGPYHVGFVLEVLTGKDKGYLLTQEGNTNTGGSPEGIGIFRRNDRKVVDCGFVKWQKL